MVPAAEEGGKNQDKYLFTKALAFPGSQLVKENNWTTTRNKADGKMPVVFVINMVKELIAIR